MSETTPLNCDICQNCSQIRVNSLICTGESNILYSKRNNFYEPWLKPGLKRLAAGQFFYGLPRCGFRNVQGPVVKMFVICGWKLTLFLAAPY